MALPPKSVWDIFRPIYWYLRVFGLWLNEFQVCVCVCAWHCNPLFSSHRFCVVLRCFIFIPSAKKPSHSMSSKQIFLIAFIMCSHLTMFMCILSLSPSAAYCQFCRQPDQNPFSVFGALLLIAWICIYLVLAYSNFDPRPYIANNDSPVLNYFAYAMTNGLMLAGMDGTLFNLFCFFLFRPLFSLSFQTKIFPTFHFLPVKLINSTVFYVRNKLQQAAGLSLAMLSTSSVHGI